MYLEGHTPRRGESGHLAFGDHVVPQPEVIRAMLLEDSRCCVGANVRHRAVGCAVGCPLVECDARCGVEVIRATLLEDSPCCGYEVIRATLLEDSPCCGVEVIRATLLEDSPCCGVPALVEEHDVPRIDLDVNQPAALLWGPVMSTVRGDKGPFEARGAHRITMRGD